MLENRTSKLPVLRFVLAAALAWSATIAFAQPATPVRGKPLAVSPANALEPATSDDPGGSEGAGAGRSGAAGFVYTTSNQTDGNRVLVFEHTGSGVLSEAGSFPTGGLGTGTGLGNQGAVVLTRDRRWLLAVSAGSSELSVFEVDGRRLILTDIVASGGLRPVSVTQHEGLVYVLNGMGAGSISGFTLSDDGRLSPIIGSTQPLSGAATTAPAQIQFNPAGNQLVVTEKATQTIDAYAVDSAGLAGPPRVNTSSSPTPFGFDFTSTGQLIVSEAVGGAAGLGVVSSYALAANGALSTISPSVPTTETAACWIAITRNGRFAYTTNTGSDSISGFAVNRDTAELALLNANGLTAVTGPGSAPIDMALSRNSGFLFVLNSGTHEIATFRANSNNGSLTPVASVAGLPMGANGLAAR